MRSYGIVMRRGKFLSPQAKRFIDRVNPQFFNEVEANPKEGTEINGAF